MLTPVSRSEWGRIVWNQEQSGTLGGLALGLILTHGRHSGGRAEMIRPILEERQPVREAATGVGVRERIATKMAGPHQGGRTMQASQRLMER
jgi:hypothetical protein